MSLIGDRDWQLVAVIGGHHGVVLEVDVHRLVELLPPAIPLLLRWGCGSLEERSNRSSASNIFVDEARWICWVLKISGGHTVLRRGKIRPDSEVRNVGGRRRFPSSNVVEGGEFSEQAAKVAPAAKPMPACSTFRLLIDESVIVLSFSGLGEE